MYKFSALKTYNLDKYLTSKGSMVKPAYDNFGIDLELLKNREAVCRTFGLTLSSSLFSSIRANQIADLLGYNIDASVR